MVPGESANGNARGPNVAGARRLHADGPERVPRGVRASVACASMATSGQFWARRLRWRLIGAWRWPLFFICTVADAFIVHELPPAGTRGLFFPALFLASFRTLVLVGGVAPWRGGRLAAGRGTTPAASFPPANHF